MKYVTYIKRQNIGVSDLYFTTVPTTKYTKSKTNTRQIYFLPCRRYFKTFNIF